MKYLPQSPHVSIIIPSYNGLEILRECLGSLNAVTYPIRKLETIVVDDGSCDGTVEELRRHYRTVKVVKNPRRLGFVKSIQKGVTLSRGAVLVFLNIDTRVDTGWLRALIDCLSPAEGIVCSCSHILSWDGARVELAGREFDAFDLNQANAAVSPTRITRKNGPTLFASGGSMAILKRAYSTIGGFDEDYEIYHEDVDLGWRLWTRGYKVWYSKESIVHHRGGSTTRTWGASPQLAEMRLYLIRNTMYTIIKNFQSRTLSRMLSPTISYMRDNALSQMQFHTMTEAIIEVELNLRKLLIKRRRVQAKRVKSDSEIFAETGHPLQFLLNSRYMLEGAFETLRFDETDLETKIRHLLFNTLAEKLAATKDFLLVNDPLGSYMALSRDPISALLFVYYSRSDLQHAFPEVRSGDYSNLIRWAARFGAKEAQVLAKHKPWYDSHVAKANVKTLRAELESVVGFVSDKLHRFYEGTSSKSSVTTASGKERTDS
jgi:GT2 family glycosyltransferase